MRIDRLRHAPFLQVRRDIALNGALGKGLEGFLLCHLLLQGNIEQAQVFVQARDPLPVLHGQLAEPARCLDHIGIAQVMSLAQRDGLFAAGAITADAAAMVAVQIPFVRPLHHLGEKLLRAHPFDHIHQAEQVGAPWLVFQPAAQLLRHLPERRQLDPLLTVGLAWRIEDQPVDFALGALGEKQQHSSQRQVGKQRNANYFAGLGLLTNAQHPFMAALTEMALATGNTCTLLHAHIQQLDQRVGQFGVSIAGFKLQQIPATGVHMLQQVIQKAGGEQRAKLHAGIIDHLPGLAWVGKKRPFGNQLAQ